VAAHRTRPQLPVDTFAEELRLVTAAQRALAQSQLDAADRSLREHATRFPRGQLAEERDATRVLVTCSRGDRDASAREAARFLAAHPRSPQAPRVRRACAVE
jgi:outer membrane protein assembly factor BamD (BamD/ComL family)